jgi:hypothetical protein
MVVTVGTYIFNSKSEKNSETLAVQKTIKTQPNQHVSAELKTDAAEVDIPAEKSCSPKQNLVTNSVDNSVLQPDNSININPETQIVQPVIPENITLKAESETSLAVNVQDTVKNYQPEEKQTLAIIQQSADWVDNIKKQDTQKPTLAAGFGSGVTGANASQLGKSMDFMAVSLTDAKTSYSSIMAPEDFRDRNFLPPVSLGVKCSYPISEKLFIESGLTYSLLITNLSNSYWGGYEAELSLHYLGIPVNLVANLIRTGKWTIYANTGFMVEKGLWSYYRQYQNWGNAEYNATASQKIDGLQWSAQAAFGVSYRFQKEFSWYLEPGLTYYFDSAQPFSIRTEMPLLLGLNAGVRINL